MKLIVAVVFTLLAVSYAVDPEPIKIVRSEYNPQPDGSYSFGYETENGIERSENGNLKEARDEDNKPQTVLEVRGSYSYKTPEGQSVVINYHADENGYQAEGDAIPKVPGA